MKITINTEILKRENLTLGEFLTLLMALYHIEYEICKDKLVDAGLVSFNIFDDTSLVLSNNTKNLVARLLIESDDKVVNSNIDFDKLAAKLCSIYPSGVKPGTTYEWSGDPSVVALKLKTLVAKHNFTFTEEEAIKATEEYVTSFGNDKEHMQLLKYFILKTSKDGNISSMFMTIIENNR